jgi:hypothetical protein
MGAQEVQQDCRGSEAAGEHTVFYGRRNDNHKLDTGFLVHKRIISAVKRVEFVSDKMSYITLRGPWCHIIALNVHDLTNKQTKNSMACVCE